MTLLASRTVGVDIAAGSIPALQAEARDYRRLTGLLRAIRQLFAEGDHEAALQECEALVPLARDLEQRALARTVLPLKSAAPATEEVEDERGPESERAREDLRAAQAQAQAELHVTAEVLCDLQVHTGALRAALGGRRCPTYDRRGHAPSPGGLGR